MKKILFALSIVLSCLAVSGCLDLPNNVPPPKTYMLSVKPTVQRHRPLTKDILVVRQALAIPPYDNDQFVYRTSHIRYLSDYYHSFLVAPVVQVTEMTMGSIEAANIFDDVLFADAYLGKRQYVLQPVLVSLYADYRNSTKPCGVVVMRYLLYRDKDKKIVMNRAFNASIPLAHKTNDALVKAWNQAFANILTRLNRRLIGIVDD